MAEKIGETAGMVWRYLNENGASTAMAISKALKADTAATHQAIGWLAREGKLNAHCTKRSVEYSLK